MSDVDCADTAREDFMLARHVYYMVLEWVFICICPILYYVFFMYKDLGSDDEKVGYMLIAFCCAAAVIFHEKLKHIQTIKKYRERMDLSVTPYPVKSFVQNKDERT